jgi:geranyl-CoA carboxylase beta subunit
MPQIAVVHGSSTAGGAYLPGLSDYVVLVGPQQHLPGRPAAGQGRHRRGRQRRGARRRRAARRVTGLGEYLCRGRRARDRHGARADRRCCPGTAGPGARRRRAAAPGEELLGVVPADEREPYDVREVIARLVDGSDFLEFKAAYAPDTVCGHARMDGHASA